MLVDHRGADAGNAISPEICARHLKPANPYILLDQPELREDLLPGLIEKTQDIASAQIAGIVTQARREMNIQLGNELIRLKELQKVNRSVRVEEIELLGQQQRALDQHLMSARLRLDAIRLIQRG